MNSGSLAGKMTLWAGKLMILLCVPMVLPAQDPLTIVQHYFDTVSNGDVSHWNDIKSVHIESITAYSAENFDKKTTDFSEKRTSLTKLFRVWPDKSRLDTYNDSTIASTFLHVDDESFFVIGNLPPMRPSAGPYESDFEFEPIMVKHVIDKRKKISLLGEKDMYGSGCYDIEVVTKSLTWHFYFNVETSLLDYWSNSPDGEPVSITRVFNYKRFGDYLIPTSETKRTEAGEFFWSRVTRLDLNVAIDPSLFVMDRK